MKRGFKMSLSMKLLPLCLALLLPGLDASAVEAEGGTETTIPSYKVHTFTATGSNSFSVTRSGYVDILLVGGGGGGGYRIGGGGGAGGFIESNRIYVVGGSNYTVTVGAGGNGSVSMSAPFGGDRGENSSFAGIVAYGGGGGRNYQENIPDPYVAVGSGGGMGKYYVLYPGTDGQGHAGGRRGHVYIAGGGGGAGAAGESKTKSPGSAGGIGRKSAITGTEKYYAGGGGGGVRSTYGTGGPGGLGGGGAGSYSGAGSAGTNNTGGGGGGGPYYSSSEMGGDGGSGIVVIRYQTADTLLILGSPSNHGSPTPPYGITNGLTNGKTVPCSVDTGWLAVASGTRATCTGYQLFTNDVLASAATTQAFTYTHNSSGTLLWQWQRQHNITFSANAGGTVSTNGGWYNEGSNVTVTATSTHPRRSFSYWIGDVPVGMETNLPLTFAADRPRAISAHFSGTNYVAFFGGSDTNDGFSWATAKKTIQAALTNALDDDIVLVSNGTYAINSPLTNIVGSVTNVAGLIITNGVTVRSVNGAGKTDIYWGGFLGEGDYRLVLLKHANAVLDGFAIYDGSYGGVYIDGAGTLQNCIVRDNTTENNNQEGAGVYLNGGGVVKNCQIINNWIKSSGGGGAAGGGIYMTGPALVDSCIISNNTSKYGTGAKAGGVYMTGAGILRNSLIAQNYCEVLAAGVYCNGGKVESCTIVDNYTPNVASVSGLYNKNGTIINTIIAFNNNVGGLSNYINTGTTWNYSYSCTDPAVAGVDNTDLDPQFVDLGAQDYSLRPGPCVDNGLNQDWMVAALDVTGSPRIVSGNVDMGALEFNPGSLQAGFSGIPTVGLASNLVVFTAYAGGTNTTGLYYKWSFNNNETIDFEGFDLAVVTNLYWPGLYSVSLTITNAAGETNAQIREQYIKVAPATNYVSTVGASIYPYDSWDNAALNIQDALDAGVDGMLVLVSNGVYGITSQIEMSRNITLRSFNGAENTTIQLKNNATGIFYLIAPSAVVDGFTISSLAGVRTSDAAVYLDRGGIVSNCVVRDNTAAASSTHGGGVHMEKGGVLKNCQIINNIARSSGGGGAFGCGIYIIKAGMVESCVITNNTPSVYGSGGGGGGVYMTGGGTLRNSLISGNQHGVRAGGVWADGGTIENCTIVSNSTPSATGVGGLYNNGRTIRNTIIVYNNNADGLSNYQNAGAATYYNCCTDPIGGLDGSDNIDSDPLFRNPAINDYRLTSASPCCNVGTNQLWMVGAFDLSGELRIRRAIVDIGAYEEQAGGSVFLFR